jgi:hypothetical protein
VESIPQPTHHQRSTSNQILRDPAAKDTIGLHHPPQLTGKNAGLKRKCNARSFIHPELDDREEAYPAVIYLIGTLLVRSPCPDALWGTDRFRFSLDVHCESVTRRRFRKNKAIMSIELIIHHGSQSRKTSASCDHFVLTRVLRVIPEDNCSLTF